MKKFTVFLSVLILSAFVGLSAFAEEEPDYNYIGDSIADALPDEASQILDQSGITPENGGAAGLSFGSVLSFLWDKLREQAEKPLKMLVSLCGTVLLCALAESLSDSGGSGLKGVFSAVSVIAGAGIAIKYMSEMLSDVMAALSGAASFMLVFIPAFAAVAAVLGYATTSSAVSAAVIAATQLFSQLAVNFLTPLCGTIMGLSVTGAIHPQLKLQRLGELIKKFVIWGLTLIMTVFMSIMSVQTFVTASSDSALIRTAKFVVSSGVPIVGGTISDAVNTVQGSLSLIKSSIGTYGLIAAAVIILPTLISTICYKAAAMCAEAASDMFGLGELSALFSSMNAVMSIIIAVQVCFLLLNTFAAVILLAVTNGS